MKDLGKSRILFGMGIQRNRKAKHLTIFQSRYVLKVIFQFNMDSAKGTSTLMGAGNKFIADTKLKHHELNRRAVGPIIYSRLNLYRYCL